MSLLEINSLHASVEGTPILKGLDLEILPPPEALRTPEFMARFPDASPFACINGFSSLFLKNDISISNLVEFMEGSDDREQLRLNQPRG